MQVLYVVLLESYKHQTHPLLMLGTSMQIIPYSGDQQCWIFSRAELKNIYILCKKYTYKKSHTSNQDVFQIWTIYHKNWEYIQNPLSNTVGWLGCDIWGCEAAEYKENKIEKLQIQGKYILTCWCSRRRYSTCKRTQTGNWINLKHFLSYTIFLLGLVHCPH